MGVADEKVLSESSIRVVPTTGVAPAIQTAALPQFKRLRKVVSAGQRQPVQSDDNDLNQYEEGGAKSQEAERKTAEEAAPKAKPEAERKAHQYAQRKQKEAAAEKAAKEAAKRQTSEQ